VSVNFPAFILFSCLKLRIMYFRATLEEDIILPVSSMQRLK
jgi:hypothetical protein